MNLDAIRRAGRILDQKEVPTNGRVMFDPATGEFITMSKVNSFTKFRLGSQNNQLVRFMFHEKRSITRLSALTSLGIANLTARITDLRDAGYQVDGDIKVDMRGNKYISYRAAQV